MGLTVLDYSDREVLWKVADTLDDDGLTTSKAVAISMGVHESEARNVAIRLAWMKRFGVVEIHERKGGEAFWTLTQEGRSMLDGDLGGMARKSLETLSPAQRVTLMEQMAHAAANGEPVWRTMMRRQWTTTAGRKGELK